MAKNCKNYNQNFSKLNLSVQKIIPGYQVWFLQVDLTLVKSISSLYQIFLKF